MVFTFYGSHTLFFFRSTRCQKMTHWDYGYKPTVILGMVNIIMGFTTLFPHQWVVPAITIGRLFKVILKL